MRRGVLAGFLLLTMPLLTACTDWMMDGPQSIWRPAGVQAQAQADLFLWIILWAAIVSFVVFTAFFFIVLRYRHRRGAPLPPQIHGNTRLEIAWTIAPAVILALIAVPTIQLIFTEQAPAPPGSLVVNVNGAQWWWDFEYPEYNVETGNLVVIPVNRPVQFNLNSEDVLHSYWIPRLGGKRDVLPNNKNTLVLEAKETGMFGGQCAEFCGASHALMLFKVQVVTEAEFEQWIRLQQAVAAVPAPGTSAAAGAALFQRAQCIGCHAVNGTIADGNFGPNLTHFGSRPEVAGFLPNTTENVIAWLRDPQKLKPGTNMPNLNLTLQEARDLAAYLEQLK